MLGVRTAGVPDCVQRLISKNSTFRLLYLFPSSDERVESVAVYCSAGLSCVSNKKDDLFTRASDTYLLTPWCGVLLENLTGLQLVKKFPAFHGTRRFITALTSVRQLSLSWASAIQSIYPHPTSWRSVLIYA